MTPVVPRSVRPAAAVLFATLAALLLLSGIGRADRTAPVRLGIRELNSQPNARILLHIVPGVLGADSAAICAALAPMACTTGQPGAVTEAPLSTAEVPYYFAYVLVSNIEAGPGFRGLQYGLEYDDAPMSGVDILDWTSCSVLEFPMENWPHSGSGNLQTFFCEQGGMTVVGYFTISVFSPDVLDLVVRPNDGALKVADCDAAETLLPEIAAGAAGFGGAAGFDPCLELADIDPPPPPEAEKLPEARLVAHVVPSAEVGANRCQGVGDQPCARGVRTWTTQASLTSPEVPEYLVYVIAAHPYPDRGVYRACFGVNYDEGIGVKEWINCGDTEAGDRFFPSSGTGNCVSWYEAAACTPRQPAIIGCFRIEARAPGLFRLGNGDSGYSGVLSYCHGVTGEITYNDFIEYDQAGAVGFGGPAGIDPCYDGGWEELAARITPVKESSWSEIKALLSR